MMFKQPINQSCRQNGVALALLVWMIAALSLMAGGIVLIARTDMRLAQMQARDVQAAALGDGAARLFLRDLMDMQRYGELVPGARVMRRYHMAGWELMVRSQPVAGLIDINSANELLWLDLLRYGANMPEDEVKALTEQLLLWRQSLSPEGSQLATRSGQFMVIEDLLLVPGMNRDVLERIRPAIHAYSMGVGGVNLLSAPAPVLRVLAHGNDDVVDRFIAERNENPLANPYGYSGLSPEHIGQGTGNMMRIDVRLASPDGQVLLHRRWVDSAAAGRDGLPWRFLHSEPVVQVSDSIEFTD